MAYPLTTAEARKHLTEYPAGASFDQALQRLLDAAQQAIDRRAPSGNVTEWLSSSTKYLYPNRPLSAVVSVKEVVGTTETTLAANDWRLVPGGYSIERLLTGTNPRGAWTGRVVLEYTPAAPTTVERELAQLQLVQLFLNHHPGLSREAIGDWDRQFNANSVYNWAIERDQILASLDLSAVAIA